MKLCACNTIHDGHLPFGRCQNCQQLKRQMKTFELNSKGKYILKDLIVKVNRRGDVNVIKLEGDTITAKIDYFRGQHV